jgi:hypothetical protein
MEWTDERAEELKVLRDLLVTMSGLNRGSLFLEKVQHCIETAQRLQESRDLHPSFISHLEKICVAEREKEREKGHP